MFLFFVDDFIKAWDFFNKCNTQVCLWIYEISYILYLLTNVSWIHIHTSMIHSFQVFIFPETKYPSAFDSISKYCQSFFTENRFFGSSIFNKLCNWCKVWKIIYFNPSTPKKHFVFGWIYFFFLRKNTQV